MRARISVTLRLIGALALAVLAAPHTALAHTDFDFSVPTEGAAVGEPVTEVTVAFTEAVTLVGPGFEVLDPQGRVLTPFAVTDDDVVFRLQLDPPLGGGLVAVKYQVAAADGHVLEGNFTFTVAADEPVVTEPPTIPPTTASPSTEPTEPTEPTGAEPSATGAEPSATDPPAADSTPEQATAAPPTASIPSVETGDAIAADDAELGAGDPASADGDDGDDGDDGGSGTPIVLIGSGVVVAGAVAFLLFRFRRVPAS